MKKLLLASLLLVSFGVASAQDHFISDLSGGMYSNASANQIPDKSAAYIQNFYTDIEPLAIEANGFQKMDSTILGGTKSVKGLWRFVDVSGNEFIIAFSSRTYYKRTSGSAWEQFGYQATSDNKPDAAVTLGKIWFTNGFDDVWSYDGTSSASYAAIPKGRLIEPWRSRLVIGNIPGSLSTLRFSEDGDGSNFVIGGNPSDPFSLQLGGANDGFNITCMFSGHNDSLIVGRKFDMWAVDGYDQTDATTRNISYEAGCLDDGSMQSKDGALIWASHRGIEAMEAMRMTNISEPIRNITDIFTKNTASLRYVTHTTSEDWLAGSFSSSVYVDTTTSDGSFRFLYPDSFDSFRDGSGLTRNVWTEYNSGGSGGLMDAYASGGYLNLYNVGGTLSRAGVRTSSLMDDFKRGTTYHFVIASMPADTATNFSNVYLTISSMVATAPSYPTSIPYTFNLVIRSTATGIASISSINASTEPVVGFSSSAFPTPLLVDVCLSTQNFTVSLNNVIVSSGIFPFVSGQQYAYLEYAKGPAGVGVALIDDFGVAPQSTVFTSSSVTVGSAITSWAALSVNSQNSNTGTATYQFNSSNTATMTEANWMSVTNGGIPTNSTNSYAALRISMQGSTWAAQVQINDYTVSWNEGSGFPEMASYVWDRRYWLSCTTNTHSGSYNDLVLVLQRNNSWTTIKGVNADSFTSWRDNFYFGNSSDNGYVYLNDRGNSFDEGPIESVLVTKSYDMGQFFKPKEFRRAYVGYLSGTSFTGTMSISYDIDRYGSLYSLGSAEMNEGQGQVATKFHFPISNLIRGRELQYTLTKNGTGDRLKLYGINTQFTLKQEE